MIELAEPNLTGSETPVEVEFEDEKTSTLIELLNKISEDVPELTESPVLDQQKRPTEAKKMHFAKQTEAADESTKAVPKLIKKPSVGKVAALLTKIPEKQEKPSEKNYCSDSKVIDVVPKKELLLTPRTLTKTQPAPHTTLHSPPRERSKIRTSRHIPFSVELGKAGRHPQYTGKSSGHQQQHHQIDLNVIELDDNQSLLAQFQDNVSDQSSTDSMAKLDIDKEL